MSSINKEIKSANCKRAWVPNLKLKDNVSFLRIASYNILADSLMSASTDIPESDLSYYPFLNWNLRKKMFLQEINHFNCDVVCIQELERDKDFIEELNNLGYELIFTPRPNSHSEGCGILSKSMRLKLINCYSLNFNMNQNDNNKFIDNKGSNFSNVFDRDNVSCIGIYQDDITKKYLIISSLHLLFNKNRGDIKIGQVYMNLKAVELLKNNLIETNQVKNDDIITFIGSDLNSLPNSAMYKLITEGEINCDFTIIDLMSGQNINLESNHNSNNSLNYKKSLMNLRNGKYDESNNSYSKFREFKSKDVFLDKNELKLKNREWYNEIMQISPILKSNKLNLEWNKNNDIKYIWKENDMKLSINDKFESAMAKFMGLIYNFYLNNDKNSNLFKNYEINDENNFFEKLSCFGMKRGSNFDSTKSFFQNCNLEPLFTKATKGVFETVDFIFFNAKNVDVLRVLDFPDFDSFFYDIKQIPNDYYPSDHMPLIADFIIN